MKTAILAALTIFMLAGSVCAKEQGRVTEFVTIGDEWVLKSDTAYYPRAKEGINMPEVASLLIGIGFLCGGIGFLLAGISALRETKPKKEGENE